MAFALAFCPVSAALYFGSLIPLAVQSKSAVVLPTVYGIGTALPVFVFAVIIALERPLDRQGIHRCNPGRALGAARDGVRDHRRRDLPLAPRHLSRHPLNCYGSER